MAILFVFNLYLSRLFFLFLTFFKKRTEKYILIHKCVDGKSSNHIYYTIHRDLLSESALQTEEIVSTSNVLKLNYGYISSELKIITDLIEHLSQHLILDNTDDFTYDSSKETSISVYVMT